MALSNSCRKITFGAITTLLLLLDVMDAQPSKIPFHRELYPVYSGSHDGLTQPGAQPFVAFREIIQIPGASWLRLHFRDYNLGEIDSMAPDINQTDSTAIWVDPLVARSYITITSLEDGGWQRLDAVSFRQWRNASAFFNGDAVEVELHVAPGDKGIFFEILEVMVGESVSEVGRTLSKTEEIQAVCGGSDERTASTDGAVGRILALNWSGYDTLALCTGWIASNGAHLTAGHCVDLDADDIVDMDVLEFNVLESDSVGNPMFSDPDDQYAIARPPDSLKYENLGEGDDWAVFYVYPNSNTDSLPVHVQGAFYRVSRDNNPTNLRLTGYGVDGPAPCFGDYRQYGCSTTNPPRDSTSQTQQTSADRNRGEQEINESSIYWEHETDTQGGSSGSPLIVPGTSLSVGVHTHGPGYRTPCPQQDYNNGTSFESNDLEDSLNTFPGTDIRYVDVGHLATTLEDGKITRPYDTVIEGVNNVPPGGIVSIVTEFYNEQMTISKAMTIEAPVGVVTIGTATLLASATQVSEVVESVKDTASSSVPAKYSLSSNYPNPFNPSTTIRYDLPEDSFLELRIYSLLGHEVRTLTEGSEAAGFKNVVWDGKNSFGNSVSSGMYFYRLDAISYESDKEFHQTRKMILLR